MTNICSAAVPDLTGVSRWYTCGLTLNADGYCPRPWADHVSALCGVCSLDAPHTCGIKIRREED